MPFQLNDPYPLQSAAAVEEEDSEFDMDSDVSDFDAQDLLKELKQLDLPHMQRQLVEQACHAR